MAAHAPSSAVETLEVVRVSRRGEGGYWRRTFFFEKKKDCWHEKPIPSMTNDLRDYSYLLTATSHFSLSHFTWLCNAPFLLQVVMVL